MKLQELRTSLYSYVTDGHLILTGVQPVVEYQDGKRTDNHVGTSYEVVAENDGYRKFRVKVNSLTPLITQEQLKASKQKHYVQFENAIAVPYRTQSGEYELSITATAVNFVKEQ